MRNILLVCSNRGYIISVVHVVKISSSSTNILKYFKLLKYNMILRTM